MKNKKKIVLIVVLITLIICGVIILIYVKPKDNSKKPQEAVVTSNIDKYGYNLLDTDTEYFKELFNKLKNVLDAEEVDKELYASLVSQLFVTDFYTLSNKLSSSDVGGLEYVSSSIRDNFALKARNTIYKSVESNLYGERDQVLPEVAKASVDSITSSTYNDLNSYNVKLSVTYTSDLGYPDTCKLVLIENDSKLEVIQVD